MNMTALFPIRLARALLCPALALAGFHAHAGAAEDPDRAIRRLAPTQIAALPAAVRADLARRGCTIPQPFDAAQPENFARGDFLGTGGRDWAVLCSVAGVSRILVYPRDGAEPVQALASAQDRGYLQQIGGGRVGFSRRIVLASIEAAARPHKGASMRYDGIQESWFQTAATVFYFDGTRWMRRHDFD